MAWILIVFLILLGGLIAPFGDLLGTKIGKARFSILKLRPKKTATIVTIITGGFISSISIGLLIFSELKNSDKGFLLTYLFCKKL